MISRRGVSPSRVFVHIADPTSWIPVDHEVDRHARDRVSTIYLPGMFLAACSLAQLTETSLPLYVRAGVQKPLSRCCSHLSTVISAWSPGGTSPFHDMAPCRTLDVEPLTQHGYTIPHVQICTHRDNYVLTFAFKIGSVDGAIEDYTISPSIISRVACDAV